MNKKKKVEENINFRIIKLSNYTITEIYNK